MLNERKHIRSSARFPLQLPVRIHWKTGDGTSREIEAETVNLSGNGIFLKASTQLRPKTSIGFSVLFPSDLTELPMELVGEGHVVRGSSPGEVGGFAAIIDDYRLRPNLSS